MPDNNNFHFAQPKIWTIGHSTRTIEEFIAMLKSFEIAVLADVRHHPGSRKFPHFNKEVFKTLLGEERIEYLSLPTLGGRRKPKPDSVHTVWRNDAFRGYADHMETEPFKDGIAELSARAITKRTAYMCSEAVWWRCHRALISDHLKASGWQVMHIMKKDGASEHPFTSAYLSELKNKEVNTSLQPDS